MREVFSLAHRAAATDSTVLITGESGVGKDVVARAIHAASRRGNRPFMAVNCAGLAETLLETELFGHVRGSFTGAHRDHVGKLQASSGGTLFLDEVGEMTLHMQALLLRVLETGEVYPVGSAGPPIRVDTRVIAATNRNLSDRVAAGQFREDLLYRLRVIPLQVPPLRQRVEDIAPLVAHFARSVRPGLQFSEEVMAALARYPWPGNVRELHNVVAQVGALADSAVVQLQDLPETIQQNARGGAFVRKERRRRVADQLFEGLIAKHCSFWDDVHPLFMSRDITRHDLRELVKRGLAETRGNYRALLKLFGLPATDYHRLHNFLAAHRCKVDYHEFRAPAEAGQRGRIDLAPKS
jgi:DNA-binding NtrC family response regulator